MVALLKSLLELFLLIAKTVQNLSLQKQIKTNQSQQEKGAAYDRLEEAIKARRDSHGAAALDRVMSDDEYKRQ